MSQAEELLNGMSEEIPVHTHPVPDTDTYFVIDPITRQIQNTNSKKNVVMQYDHNSERFTFELPRFVDGHDMLECTSVTVNVDNIEVVESGEDEEVVEPRVNSDAPDMADLRVHPNDPEKVICSWLISRNSTQLAGILSFHIEFKCVDSNGNVVYEWSTDTYSNITVKARKKNGEAAIAEHTDLLEQWRTRIFGAGDSVMANIAAEGEAQVAAVKAESETQQEAVELKGAQTLDSIPEDYTEVDVMADEAVRTKADAIVCEAAGESIAVKDSSNDHIRGLKLFGKTTQKTTTGKNLLQHSLGVGSHTIKGITFEIREDGSVLCNGTATNPATLSFEQYNLTEDIIVSGCPANGSTQTYRITIDTYKDDAYVRTEFDLGSSITIHKDRADYVKINIYFYTGIVANGLAFYPMIRLASVTDDTYEPYTGGKPSPNPEYPQEIVSVENPTIRTYGSNMFDIESFIKNAHDKGAQHYVKLADGDLQINTLAYMENYTAFDFGFKPLTPYTLSFKPVWVDRSSDNVQFSIKFIYDDGTESIYSIVYSDGERVRYCKSSGDKNLAYIAIGRWAQNGTCKLLNVYLTEGSFTADDMPSYKPYSGGTLTLDRNFPGIPVTSGGNYTDSDGQQWICDEVDLEREMYVQRIKTITLDGSDNEGWMLYDNNVSQGMSFVYYPYDGVKYFQSSMCDKYRNVNGCWGEPYKGQLGIYSDHNNVSGRYFRPPNDSVNSLEEWLVWLAANPLKLAYILATPIETPLSAEEIAAFKALRTNYPNTTILNDAGAWMSVKYNADTKTYVENPKTLKLVDSSTGVVYELKIVNGSLTVNPV